MTFEIEQTIGDYQILGILGRGGMGAVYRVRNTLTDREEAMKIVLPGAETTGEVADRFLREIRIQASLQHPHIAAIRTAFRSGESVLMIMELIEGVALDARVKEGPLPLGDVFRITDDILSALSHAHARGIVHRDIKPLNIIVTPRGAPKLTDFGIATAAACAISSGTESGSEITCAAMISFSFQPNPFADPYRLIIGCGATSGVLWHCRQAAVARIGCAKYSAGPVADSRSPLN